MADDPPPSDSKPIIFDKANAITILLSGLVTGFVKVCQLSRPTSFHPPLVEGPLAFVFHQAVGFGVQYSWGATLLRWGGRADGPPSPTGPHR